MLLDHLFRHEANSLSPVPRLVRLNVDCQVKLEVVRVVLLKSLKLLFQQDVIYRPVAEDHPVVRAVLVSEC